MARTTGDDWSIQATLYEDGELFDFTDETVVAAIVSDNGNTPTIIATAESINETASDRANGVLVFTFSSALTSTITEYGRRYLEVQATNGTDGTVRTWHDMTIDIRGDAIDP